MCSGCLFEMCVEFLDQDRLGLARGARSVNEGGTWVLQRSSSYLNVSHTEGCDILDAGAGDTRRLEG